MKSKYLILAILMFVFIVFLSLFVFVPKLSVGLVEAECNGCGSVSALKIASQLGRLDAISLALAFLGIGVGFFAILSFFTVKEDAQETATKVAEQYYAERWGRLARKIDNQIDAKMRAALAENLGRPQVDDLDVSKREEETDNER